MTLQKQVLALPIVGGLNEKEDALLSLHPQQMTNCVYRKSGAVSKRYGYDCIGAYNLAYNATTTPTPAGEVLTTYNDELIRIGGGKLFTYRLFTEGATQYDWAERGLLPEVTATRTPLSTASAGINYFSSPVVAYLLGYSVTVYGNTDGLGNFRLYADVIHVATGVRVFTQYLLETQTGVLQNPRIDASGSTVGVFWFNSVNSTVYGKMLNLSTMTWGTTSTVWSGLSTFAYDVAAISDNVYVGCFATSAGTDRIWLQSVNTSGSSGAYAALGGGAIAGSGTGTAPTSISIKLISGERTWAAVAYEDGGALTTTVKVFTAAPTQAATLESGPTSVYSAAIALAGINGDGTDTVAIEQIATNSAVLVWHRLNQQTLWQNVLRNSGTGVLTGAYASPHVLERSWLISRPFVRDGRSYAVVANVHGTHTTHFVVDLLATQTLSDGTVVRLSAVALPRQFPPINITNTVMPRYRTTSNVVPTVAGEYLVATLTGSSNIFNITGLRLKFGAPRGVASTASMLLVGGGVLTGYDGTKTFEIGMAYEPDASYLAAFTTGTAGGMIPGLTYNYKFVYAWKDVNGNTIRGAPSLPKSVTMGAAQTSVNGTVPPLQLTNRGTLPTASVPGSLQIEIYRTGSTGGVATGTYQLVKSIPNAAGAAIAFVDGMADTDLALKAPLYTTGGIIDHVAPPSASLVYIWKNCVVLGGTDDDSVWFSGGLVRGEGPWFNDGSTLNAFEGGPVTAISSVDGTLVLFKADGIWTLEGEPPNNLGSSSLSSPRRVQTDVGCADAKSVIITSDGVLFKGRTGIYLLNRSLQVVPLGRAVEDSYRAEGFAGVASLPAQGLVRWLQAGTSTAFDALNFDGYHAAVYGQPVWSKDSLYDVRASAAASPVACTMWRGTFVWLSAAGYLYQESSTNFADTDGLGVSRWVPMTFETSVEKAGSLSDFQRIWRAVLLGNYVSPHGLTVTLTTDAGAESRVWTSAEIGAFLGLPVEKFLLHVAQQKCQWMRVKILDNAPPSAPYGTYAGMTLRDVSLVLGVKGKGARVPAANRK